LPVSPDALVRLGWVDDLAAHVPPGAAPGRVLRADRGAVTVETADGTVRAQSARTPAATVGDWVAVQDGDPPLTVALLPRRSALSRHAAWRATVEQVLAANVDVVFLVASLEPPPNLRRLERALVVAWSSGAQPVIVLTKADRCPDVDAVLGAIDTVALGVDVVVTSAVTGQGLGDLRRWTSPGEDGTVPTIALLGASGAGKSTLVNALLGEERMATSAEREGDGRGRHTTTHRELVPLPDGGLLLDTPGLREIQLWDAAEGMQEAFADVEELATQCRFSDCAH